MQFISIKTRILTPPKDNFLEVLGESLSDVKEGDIVAISSKVVSIHEGNCIEIDTVDKRELLEEEADVCIRREYWSSPLTIKNSAFIGTAGIDESNANGYYVLLPKDPFFSAKYIYEYIKNKFGLKQFGVLITDSHSSPLRRGATGISIGFWGFRPTINHIGEPDLFGREFKIEVSNLIDGIAAGANIVMGETNECQPIVLVRGVPKIKFSEGDFKDEVFVDFKDDTFRVLYERFLE